MGQLRPGDLVRFVPISYDTAVGIDELISETIESLDLKQKLDLDSVRSCGMCVLNSLPAEENRPLVMYRQAGDSYLLVEYGDMELDLAFRVRIHSLMEAIDDRELEGILELSPGVRSLQIHFDHFKVSRSQLITLLINIESTLPDTFTVEVPCRIVELPLAFEDSATLNAVDRYCQTVRSSAPWLPNNVDFIQRINGLSSREQVCSTITSASYLVLGLGDVYLGAPCAVPLDPRHRLVTSKYNPARTYTAEGTVGIGGVYMCIYGMDSPGGYQLVGRTIPIWSRDRLNTEPWLLKNFDMVSFYLVSEDELLQMRRIKNFSSAIRMKNSSFKLSEYAKFLSDNGESITAFKTRQKEAFDNEITLWDSYSNSESMDDSSKDLININDEHVMVTAVSYGCVWKVLIKEGNIVSAGQEVLVLEAMKMETKVTSPCRGVVHSINCVTGKVKRFSLKTN